MEVEEQSGSGTLPCDPANYNNQDAEQEEAEEVDEGGTATSTTVQLMEHSNANLLKMNTHDKYSTVGAIKKQILKDLPPPATAPPPQPLLPGMLRMNKNPKNPHIFVAFDTPEHRDSARALLSQMCYRKQQWVEVEVSAKELELTHKGKRGRDDDAGGPSPQGASATAPQAGGGVNAWAEMPLDEQLKKKEQHCIKVMKVIVPPSHANGFVSYRTRFQGVFRPSPTEGYRNHVNFSCGFDRAGKPTVGFNEGALVEGHVHVLPASSTVTTNPLAVVIADAVAELVHQFATESEGNVTVFSRATATGFWRRVQVRHNVDGQLMLCFELDSTGLSEEQFQAYLSRIVAQCATLPATVAKLKAIQGTAEVVSVQYYTHSGSGTIQNIDRKVIYGAATMDETLCGLKFAVSPSAFFQVNTPGMELMLHHVRESAQLRPNTTLLDLCCGTGTIGLCLAKYVRKVIGIELVPEAVENAKQNAKRNQISNATFYAGRLEHLLPDIINALSLEDLEDVVAILDPPRAGVTSTVLKWVRSTEAIRRAVYISCEQKALERDCPAFTKPATNSYRGLPFVVESAFGIDLFPHTPHVEMVGVLARTTAAAAAAAGTTATTSASSTTSVVECAPVTENQSTTSQNELEAGAAAEAAV